MLRAALVFAALLASASAHGAKQPYIVGNWYGEGQPTNRDAYWVSHEFPDGRIEIRFRGCHKGKTLWESTLKGTWRIIGDVEELTITNANGQKTLYKDRYRMLGFDGRKRTYRREKDGTLFASVKVDQKFQLPSCARLS